MTELAGWLAHRLNSGGTDVAPSPYRVTVRLEHGLHQKLVRLASAVRMSKTATAEDILSASIKDAWLEYVSTLDENAREDLRNEMHTELESEFKDQFAGSDDA